MSLKLQGTIILISNKELTDGEVNNNDCYVSNYECFPVFICKNPALKRNNKINFVGERSIFSV